jgi:hypothetical protein
MKNLLLYGGVRHGYSQPGNGNDPSRSSMYNERAAKQSGASMRTSSTLCCASNGTPARNRGDEERGAGRALTPNQ